jgi:hypothetical protein
MHVSSRRGVRLISILLLLVGVLWGLISLAVVVVFGGFLVHVPQLSLLLIGNLLLIFTGPLLLIGGAITVLRGSYPRAGATAAMIGCAILTVMAAYPTPQIFRDLANPALTRPPYGEYAIVAIVILLADAGAVRVFRTTV